MKKCMGVLCVILILGVSVSFHAMAAATETDAPESGGRPEVIVEVVGDIPAEEIEDDAVPLAAVPDDVRAGHSGRGIVLICALVGAVMVAGFLRGRRTRQLLRRRKEAYRMELSAEKAEK